MQKKSTGKGKPMMSDSQRKRMMRGDHYERDHVAMSGEFGQPPMKRKGAKKGK